MIRPDQILTQLAAIRGLCDALATALMEDAVRSEPVAAGCSHPPEQREIGTLRGPGPKQFYCRACHEIVTEPFN